MSAEQMLAKAISAKYYKGNGGDMSMLNILQGYNWSDADREGITRTIKQYRQENYPYIKYNPAGVKTDINDVLAYLDAIGAAAQEAGQPAPAAVIDYFHLLTSRDQLDTDELIKQAITGLKQYAIKYDTFVIGIIAANRDSMKNGRYTINSGRDSSNIEYTADYMLSLNYTEIDSGKVKPDDTEGVEQLQTKRLRDMIIRVLKARLTGTQRAEYVSFDARHNIFYGTANEFETVTDAPAFDSTNIVKRI